MEKLNTYFVSKEDIYSFKNRIITIINAKNLEDLEQGINRFGYKNIIIKKLDTTMSGRQFGITLTKGSLVTWRKTKNLETSLF